MSGTAADMDFLDDDYVERDLEDAPELDMSADHRKERSISTGMRFYQSGYVYDGKGKVLGVDEDYVEPVVEPLGDDEYTPERPKIRGVEGVIPQKQFDDNAAIVERAKSTAKQKSAKRAAPAQLNSDLSGFNGEGRTAGVPDEIRKAKRENAAALAAEEHAE